MKPTLSTDLSGSRRAEDLRTARARRSSAGPLLLALALAPCAGSSLADATTLHGLGDFDCVVEPSAVVDLGAAVPGLAMYMLIGRTPDYAWSLTSATNDVRDIFVEVLCEPDGSTPSRTSGHYEFDGECVPFEKRLLESFPEGTDRISENMVEHRRVTLPAQSSPGVRSVMIAVRTDTPSDR